MSTASFIGSDTTTKGSWRGVYGSDGNYIATLAANQPPGRTVTLVTGATFAWDPASADPRSLQYPTGSSRIASIFFGNPVLHSIISSVSKPYDLQVYFDDHDLGGRACSVNIYDWNTLASLDTQSVSSTNYANGYWLKWQITGDIGINCTLVSGPNIGPSGIFISEQGRGAKGGGNNGKGKGGGGKNVIVPLGACLMNIGNPGVDF